MPSYRGMNQKSLSAKAAKEQQRKNKLMEEQKQKEELLWKDEVTEAILNKKETLLNKQQEKAQRKLENRKLAEEESKNISSSNKKSDNKTPKLSRSEIQRRVLMSSLKATTPVEESQDLLLVENQNRALQRDKELASLENVELISASSVSEFLDITKGPPVADRFIEKRLKAAYAAYEERQMELIKKEFPGLKRSQYHEKIWKQWQKSPENPLNQTA